MAYRAVELLYTRYTNVMPSNPPVVIVCGCLASSTIKQLRPAPRGRFENNHALLIALPVRYLPKNTLYSSTIAALLCRPPAPPIALDLLPARSPSVCFLRLSSVAVAASVTVLLAPCASSLLFLVSLFFPFRHPSP